MWLEYFILGCFGVVLAENQIQKLKETNQRNDCDVDCEAESVACIENCDITDQECVRNCLSSVLHFVRDADSLKLSDIFVENRYKEMKSIALMNATETKNRSWC